MSFYMDVEVDGLTWDRARHLARKCSPPHGLSIVKPRRGLFGGRGPRKLVISDSYAGESILADDADWDAPAWSMRPETLPKLEATLRCLCSHIPEGFAFVAAWVSDPIENQQELSCDELIEIVSRSALNGRRRYRVKPSARPMPEELDLDEADAATVGYVSDLYELLRAIDAIMPKDATLYIEATSIVPEVKEFLTARHAEEWQDVVPHTGWPIPETYHLPLSGTNLMELREIASRYAEPEVCDHLVVYRSREVLLKAHDAGSGYVAVNRNLTVETIRRFKEELGHAIHKKKTEARNRTAESDG